MTDQWHWRMQCSQPHIIAGEVCSSIHCFPLHQTEWWACLFNIFICPWLIFTCLPQPKRKTKSRRKTIEILFNAIPKSFSKRNDYRCRTLLTYGTIHLLGNSENGFQKNIWWVIVPSYWWIQQEIRCNMPSHLNEAWSNSSLSLKDDILSQWLIS